MKKYISILMMLVMVLFASAMTWTFMPPPDGKKDGNAQSKDGKPADDKANPDGDKAKKADSKKTSGKKTSLDKYREKMAKLKLQKDTIPDSLLHPRWKIQKTVPVTYDDLKQGSADLQRPENIKQEVEYNDTIDRYIIGNRLGKSWLTTPIMMTLPEYQKWSEKNLFTNYFRNKNSEIFETKGKEKFDWQDMHFDLGPAEKIFGPGGIRVKTQGTAELKLGATLKNIDNPSLPIKNRKTTSVDFDEKININVTGKIGDKMNMNLNYNTDATFDYDAQNMKLKYDGKEDEIVKLVEAGNVSFPSNSSLIQGSSSLFGVRTDLQFGKLKLQTVISQKKSTSSSVSSQGGTQLTPFEMDVTKYEENRHFYLGMYFRKNYDNWMKSLPTINSGITINRVEVWVTNKSGQTSNTRNIIALSELGEDANGTAVPQNSNGTVYSYFQTGGSLEAARDINQTSSVIGDNLKSGEQYEKIEKARLLSSSEYTLNSSMGYISLKTTLQSDQVLAIAYEYTYLGSTYQVGEFSSDYTDVNKCLVVKALKNTSSTPTQPNWKLMMRNVYYLASSVEKEKFKLDVKYQSDSVGVYVNYIPESQSKSTPIIKLIGADRLDNNNRANSNGRFDYVEGYTVSNGRVFFPTAEPFGTTLYNALIAKGVSASVAEKYRYQELYDSTSTVAKQIAEKNRFQMVGQYKGSSANVISLGATNVPQGSVVVTAGGTTLTEGTDYSVDYSAGEVTILNQSIIDAGTSVNVSCESQSDYGMERKTMFGINWEYDFSKDFQLSGTVQHLSEQSLTSKVTMGCEPVNNTLLGFNINWKKDSQWLTNMLNKIPFLHVTQPSNIQFNAEFAKLFSSVASGTQDNASYIDDFENTTNGISVITPTSWTLSSVPKDMPDAASSPLVYNKTDLQSGYNRARLAWYTIDPLFTRRSSSLTPGHIKEDVKQLSNHYVREVYVSELYPNRDQSTYSGATSTLSILNLAFYPQERGPYNFNPDMDEMGHLKYPEQSWGGMMRKLDTNDFEEANIEYIEFWMMDPFIYTSQDGTADKHTGKLYFDLGEVSEDILLDGRKCYESGMPINESDSTASTVWGKVPVQNTVTYAFATSGGSREKQDVGFNGLSDAEEMTWSSYQDYLNAALGPNHDGVGGIVTNDSVKKLIMKDPAFDDYHYFRGSDWDEQRTSILDRYKFINNPQGNSPDSENQSESYDTSYKTTPDVEDINQDYTLNEYEKYWEYSIDIDPNKMTVGSNHISDIREATASLRDGSTASVKWYQFRIPINSGEKHGNISDFSSIRFMRMFMKGFKEPTILRFGSLDLVRGDWRVYEQQIKGANANPTATFNASAISIEENNEKKPVNYVLPPGISRVVDPSQPQLVENNEQALRMDISNMSHADAVAVYKNTTYDMRYYKHLQMFVHANATEQNTTNLQNDQLALFMRLGSDYNNNYYEYEIPLKLTAAGTYNTYSATDCKAVWPEDNMLDIELSKLTALKKARNQKKAQGLADFSHVYSEYDSDNQRNKISIVGNPSLGEVKTMMIGVRNLSNDIKDGEVWVNELRLLDPESEGGWAAAANLNIQLSDFGSVAASGKYVSDGFGGLEQKTTERSMNKYATYSVTTNLELGKFFPDKLKVTAPLYYSYTREQTTPKYNPLDTDMKLDDALESAQDDHERDSIKSIAITNVISKNLSLSGVRLGISTKRHPMPYDPANFSFSYSHSHKHTDGETTVYENDDSWRGAMTYSWTPVYKSFEPFKKWKTKSKYADILKKFAFNWLPQNISANTEITRTYYELQERDLEDLGSTSSIPVSFNSQFLWNRDFSLRWDFTKNLHMNFQSATRAEIEEPYTPVNADLYPERYEAWKDSVWQSIKHLGTPLDYNQTYTASYQVPLNLLPCFDWLTANGTYNSSYHWARGTKQEDGSTLGNTITTNRTVNINSTLNMEKLYNHVPFLKKVNERFSKNPQKTQQKKTTKVNKPKDDGSKIDPEQAKKNEEAKKLADAKAADNKRKKNTYTSEISIKADTFAIVTHGKKSKRLIVTAKDENGNVINLKYKKIDENKIKVYNKADSAVKMKVSVLALEPLENLSWYKVAQSAARVAMMVRNISISYRNQYSMSLPGFKPNAGDIFGQNSGGALAPGLDFAFGLIDDSYLDKANRNDWLMGATGDSITVSSPATTSKTEDLQIKMTLEPIRNLKIDLNMSRTFTRSNSIQYMYSGMPTTQSGSFNMTTISIKSAFEGIGDADNGFKSASFEKFCNSLEGYRVRVQNQYQNVPYPDGSTLAGQRFKESNGGVNAYSADVMIPAFLNAYTGNSDLSIFPTLWRMLPNWTLKYSGLSQLPWIRDHFKSVNINHGYKSIYSVGSYSSYATYKSFMGETIGFVTDATTGNPTPSSMFNVSTVSINEAFSPLLGIDFTLPSNITFKAEYRTTRVLTLSTTSVQINETLSKDWVFGMGYKIADFRFFKSRAILQAQKSRSKNNGDEDSNNSKGKSNSKSNSNTKTKGFAHDLNLRLDLSYRQQAAITRDIATVKSQATSGNNAFKLAFSADYSLSKLLTMSFYYDRQSNTPLLSSGSYPTVTQDFGLSMKFSLTR